MNPISSSAPHLAAPAPAPGAGAGGAINLAPAALHQVAPAAIAPLQQPFVLPTEAAVRQWAERFVEEVWRGDDRASKRTVMPHLREHFHIPVGVPCDHLYNWYTPLWDAYQESVRQGAIGTYWSARAQ